MPTVTVGDYIQAIAQFRYDNGVTGLNRFAYVVTGEGSAEYSDCIENIGDALGAGYNYWLSLCSQVVTYTVFDFSVVAYSYLANEWRVVSKMGFYLFNEKGQSTYEPLPSTLTASVTLTTGLSRVRGRKSMPGLTDGIVDQDELTTDAINNLGLMATAWRSPVQLVPGLEAKWVLLQRVSGHTAITGVKVGKIVGSQDTRDRRRHK